MDQTRRAFCQYLAAMGLLQVIAPGCMNSPESSLKGAFTVPDVEWGNGIWVVTGNRFHSVYLMRREHGYVFFVSLRLRSGKRGMAPAVALNPNSEQLVAVIPAKYCGEDTRGSRVMFCSHDGRGYFGNAEYYVHDSEEGPDWKQGIPLHVGHTNVQFYGPGSLDQLRIARQWQYAKECLQELLGKSPSLRREIRKEDFAPIANGAMVLTKLLWATASWGWAIAPDSPEMYEDKTWNTVWSTANYLWSIEKLAQIVGIDLTESWKGQLGTRLASENEHVASDMRFHNWERELKKREPKAFEAYELCSKRHFGADYKLPRKSRKTQPNIPQLPRQPSLPSEEQLGK